MEEYDNYTPDYDDGQQFIQDEEEAFIAHTVNDVNSIISEVGIDHIMRNLNEYSIEQMVKWLAKKY